MTKLELLAPAGDGESLAAALRYGADAVYLGGELLQLRAKSAGFTREDLSRAVELAHGAGRRLYVAVNALARSQEIPLLSGYARFLRDAGVDAAIVSDVGVIDTFKKAAPELELHLSTQAGCMNYAAARVYWDMGVRRIVLAREMCLEDIAQLRAKTPPELELEAFVHGAMCMAVSGRCILSSYLTGRSGNRGECAQPCRWNWALTEEKRPGEYFPVVEEDGYTALLSSHDLCCIDMLDELQRAGVTSFKIEGRMKTAYYVATVVNAYRMALDGGDTALCREELELIKHRPYSDGFYHGYLKEHHINSGRYEHGAVFVGSVLEAGDGFLTVRQRNHFRVGDTLEILSPGRPPESFSVTELITADGERRDAAPHPNEILTVPCRTGARPGDFLRRREHG